MDEEERKRMEQQMLTGTTSQNDTLPEQPAPQTPIAPQAQAPVAETGGDVVNIPIAPPIPEGAPGSPQENFRQRMLEGAVLDEEKIRQAEAFAESMGTTFDPATGYAPIAERPVEMGPMQFIDTRTGEPLAPEVVKGVQDAGMGGFLAQASFPVPQAPAPQAVAPQAPIAPMGPEETRARLGGMTLNEYLNAPSGTPGVSGMRTDEQGRMKPPEYFGPAPTQGETPAPSPAIAGVTPEAGQGATPAPSGQTPIAQAPAPLSNYDIQSQAMQDRIAAKDAARNSGAQVSQTVPQDVRIALATPPGSRTPEQQARIARWSSSTQGQQMGGEAGYKDSLKTPDQKKAEALAIEAQEIANEAARLGISQSEAAELRRKAAEDRAVKADQRADELLQIQKDQEERAKRGEQRTIQNDLAAQAHALKSQEQRDREIELKEEKLRIEIAEANRRNPTEGAKYVEAKKFMDENNLIFDNGVLYEKTGWTKGQMVKVTNPAFMDVPGMEFLRQTSMGPTGNTPVDYSNFSVRAVGTAAPGTAATGTPATGTPATGTPAQGTSAPATTPPANVTVPPATETNNAVTTEALNSVAAPNTPTRRPGETETSFMMRRFREEEARRRAAFLANQ